MICLLFYLLIYLLIYLLQQANHLLEMIYLLPKYRNSVVRVVVDRKEADDEIHVLEDTLFILQQALLSHTKFF